MAPYAVFLGCNIPARVKQYEDATRAVLAHLDVQLVDFKEFMCCGYPLRNLDEEAYLTSAAYNLALAEKSGMDLLVLCKCGFGTFKEAEHRLKENTSLRNAVNRTLKDKGLSYEGHITAKHLLSVLYHDVGIDALKKKRRKVFKDLKIAVHYGCHALRPSALTQFDNPVAPTIFDDLVEVTGAKSVDWASKLECCGGPLLGTNDDVSLRLTARKLEDGKKAGAQYLCTACPYCHIQFDGVQKNAFSLENNGKPLPPILYPQLLGLSLGLDQRHLGLELNQLNIKDVLGLLTEE